MPHPKLTRRQLLQSAPLVAAAPQAPIPGPRPTPAQKAWMKLRYGMFLHYGPNAFAGVGWGDGKFPPADFAPKKLDTGQWAETAAEAGMKYAVLTTKHHDGFCLWPSRHTEYCVKNSPSGDVAASYAESFRKAGLKVGFYYSLWDRNCKFYEDDQRYAEYMQAQVRELCENYGEVTEFWFDGAWDKDHPTRKWPYDPAWEKDPNSGLGHGERWQWKELYNLIHKLQPNCLVFNNSSSDRPGGVRYMPVDGRTAEHFDFIYKGQITEVKTDPWYFPGNQKPVYLPLEYCTTLNPGWFWKDAQHLNHPSVGTICDWYQRAREDGANLLLNVGPSRDGLIPEYHREYLKKAARRLAL